MRRPARQRKKRT
ncbi:hypothetical protein YPPY01_4244, partial [Yersinia pestis PY-01]